jgi:hypothetical protein
LNHLIGRRVSPTVSSQTRTVAGITDARSATRCFRRHLSPPRPLDFVGEGLVPSPTVPDRRGGCELGWIAEQFWALSTSSSSLERHPRAKESSNQYRAQHRDGECTCGRTRPEHGMVRHTARRAPVPTVRAITWLVHSRHARGWNRRPPPSARSGTLPRGRTHGPFEADSGWGQMCCPSFRTWIHGHASGIVHAEDCEP